MALQDADRVVVQGHDAEAAVRLRFGRLDLPAVLNELAGDREGVPVEVMFRAQVLRELNRIGGNVNQIARALNSDLTPPDIRHRLDELHRLLEMIAEALREPADSTVSR